MTCNVSLSPCLPVDVSLSPCLPVSLPAGSQVELPVLLPGVAGGAAAVRAALPPREPPLPADGEEGRGRSPER